MFRNGKRHSKRFTNDTRRHRIGGAGWSDGQQWRDDYRDSGVLELLRSAGAVPC
jgi:hypothetical protein